MPQPVLAGRLAAARGVDAGAIQAILRQCTHHVTAAAIEQVGLDAEPPGFRRCLQLGAHATGAGTRTGATSHGQHGLIQFGHVVQWPCVGGRARVGAVQAIDVGGDEQCIGIDQRGDRGGQVVVVPELDRSSSLSVARALR
ncbi:hypothetical protein G6F22_018335 [Rhizopus arrhizus]|nr:hypothetical protein G6F22_018335 [Rhizopus arrhizus]